MAFQQILYHGSLGTKTDYGWYYKFVYSQEEHDRMLQEGWVIHPTLLDEPQFQTCSNEAAAVTLPESLEPLGQADPELRPAIVKKRRGRKAA